MGFWENLKATGATALGALRGGWFRFWGWFFGDIIWKGLSTGVSIGAMWAFHGLVRLFPTQAIAIAEFVTKTYYTPPVEWAGFVKEFIEKLTDTKITDEQLDKILHGGGGRVVAEALGETFMNPLLKTIAPEKELDPQLGIDNAEAYLGINLQFQMSAWLLHMLGDMISFGTFKGMKDLPNAISWSFGLGWLSWLVMGTPFRIAISTPQEWAYNYVYRPARLNERERALFAVVYEDSIKPFQEYVRFLGWDYDMSRFLYDVYSDKPTFSQIRDLYYHTDLGEEGLEKLLKWQGWNYKFREYALKLIKYDRLWNLKEDLDQEVLRAYREGRLTREQAVSDLRDSGWNDTEIETALTVQDMIAQRRRDLPLSTIDKAYEYGLISDEKWWEYYLRAGYTPEDIQLILSIRQFEKTLEEANRVYWARRQELTSKLHDAGVEDYWFIAADELGTDRQSIMKIGTMSEQEWIKLMNKIIEKYK